MTQTINFATLSLMDALDFAILIEEEAEDRYGEFAEQMEAFFTPAAALFFRMMAGNEAKHGSELKARRRTLFGDAPATVDRTMLWDVEAPSYDRARAFMTPRRVLEVAMASEVKAHDFFAAAIPHINDKDVKALFEELRLEEIDHQRLVREKLDEQPPDDGTDPDEDRDEPFEL
jgi:rubrerythrin